MDCATTSGSGSRTGCRGGSAMLARPLKTIVDSSKQCSIATAGIPWRDLPPRLGDWKNTHRRFTRWAKTGAWQQIFEHLAAAADNEAAAADNEYAMLDSTIVRAHQHSAGAVKKTP